MMLQSTAGLFKTLDNLFNIHIDTKDFPHLPALTLEL